MFSAPRVVVVVIVSFELFAPVTTSAQVNFEKNGYYLSLGDSVRAVYQPRPRRKWEVRPINHFNIIFTRCREAEVRSDSLGSLAARRRPRRLIDPRP